MKDIINRRQREALVWLLVLVAIVVFVLYLTRERRVVVFDERRVEVFDTVRVIEIPQRGLIRLRRVELNGADTAALRKVYGIGTLLAQKIVEYRARLGGFYSVEQLREIRGLNFEMVCENFWVDTLGIRKIRINFATHKELSEHPYIGANAARRIVRGVELKGGYATLERLKEDEILLPQEARRLAPYLSYERNNNN